MKHFLLDPELFEQAGMKFQESPSSVLTNCRQKHETQDTRVSLGAQAINRRMNDRVITTPTKPAERNP